MAEAQPIIPSLAPIAVSPELEARRSFAQVLHGWIVTVDHKRLGLMYFTYGMVMLVVGGIEASIVRAQLAIANNHLVSPETFNRMFTMHGTTMIFFSIMPLIFGFANYLVPLMIGARDMAFPRLNAWGFWMSAFGGIILYFSFIGGYGLYGAGRAPDVGWFAYAPLTSSAFSVGHSTDYWIIGILVSGFGSIATAVNINQASIGIRLKLPIGSDSGLRCLATGLVPLNYEHRCSTRKRFRGRHEIQDIYTRYRNNDTLCAGNLGYTGRTRSSS